MLFWHRGHYLSNARFRNYRDTFFSILSQSEGRGYSHLYNPVIIPVPNNADHNRSKPSFDRLGSALFEETKIVLYSPEKWLKITENRSDAQSKIARIKAGENRSGPFIRSLTWTLNNI